MNCKIEVTAQFRKDAKRLAKKYRSLASDLTSLQKELIENPYSGVKISGNFYKIRLTIKSKGKGKSGGARAITHIEAEINEEDEIIRIVLLKLYDKSDTASIKNSELSKMLDTHLAETEEE